MGKVNLLFIINCLIEMCDLFHLAFEKWFTWLILLIKNKIVNLLKQIQIKEHICIDIWWSVFCVFVKVYASQSDGCLNYSLSGWMAGSLLSTAFSVMDRS